ncbi:MAG: hypothetical protein J6C40_16165 [Lentisphaeria bacterium]|nr:hypothetical protein [Lentisphaeria bacterium]
MKQKIILFAAVFLLLGKASALPVGIVPDGKTNFKADTLQFAFMLVDSKWQGGKFRDHKSRVLPDGSVMADYQVDFGKANGSLSIMISPVAGKKDAFRILAECKYPDGVKKGVRALAISIPVKEAGKAVFFRNGKKIDFKFPEKYKKMELGTFGGCTGGELLLTNGRKLSFQSSNTVYLQDNRKFKLHDFSMRFWFSGDKLDVTLELQKPQFKTVSFTGSANRSFSDDAADDGKGGWTDQGSSNDLRMVPVGSRTFNKIPFTVIDEKKAAAPGAIIVAGERRNFAPHEIELPLPEMKGVKTLLLLHTAAWVGSGNKIGELEVAYKDTSRETIPVVDGKDVANWWGPGDRANAKVAWRSQNPEMPVGLYVSAFQFSGVDPVSVKFRITDRNASWMIAAATLSDQNFFMPAHTPRPVVTVAGKEWIKMDFQQRVTPGSPLDFSFLLTPDAPAGKYGRLTVNKDGSMSFEKAPGKRFRANGVNLCDTVCYLSREQADRLVTYLAALGINSVRYHHHDNALRHPTDPTPGALNMANLDKLDYLTAKLIEKGIYITFDFYTSRRLRPGEELPLLKKYPGLSLKTALEQSPEGMANWKAFAANWMNHKNPYTGRKWAEEPAIIFANLVNEDTETYLLFNSKVTIRYYQDIFGEYCRKNNLKDTRVSMGNKEFIRFLTTLQQEKTAEMMRYLKEELNVRFALTSANYNGNSLTTYLRSVYDVVDDHAYHAHASFPKKPWVHPHRYNQNSILESDASVPLLLFRGRIFGKPFFISEFNFCAPNIYRAEGGVVMGAYCALQDATGIYRYNFCGNVRRLFNKDTGIILFEMDHDPMMLLSQRIEAVFLLRGDVAPAQGAWSWKLEKDYWKNYKGSGYPDVRTLGLFEKIGVNHEGKTMIPTRDYTSCTAQDDLGKRLAAFRKSGVAVSSTGELRLDTKQKSFTVVTPKSEAVVIRKDKQMKAGLMTVSKPSVFQSVTAIALDNRELRKSDSILVLQLTDAVATGTRFADEDFVLMEHYGKAPLLLKKGSCFITLNTGKNYKVTALNMQGDALGTLNGSLKNNVFSFTADNSRFPGGIVAYHLTTIKK